MPHFYFHLTTRKGWERDEIGTPFETADHAMLEAWRTACEMSVEAIRHGESPAGHRFEVCDEAGQLVFELRFSELFTRPTKRLGGQDSPVLARLQKTMATTLRLRSEMAAALLSVQSTMAQTSALLSRDSRVR